MHGHPASTMDMHCVKDAGMYVHCCLHYADCQQPWAQLPPVMHAHPASTMDMHCIGWRRDVRVILLIAACGLLAALGPAAFSHAWTSTSTKDMHCSKDFGGVCLLSTVCRLSCSTGLRRSYSRMDFPHQPWPCIAVTTQRCGCIAVCSLCRVPAAAMNSNH